MPRIAFIGVRISWLTLGGNQREAARLLGISHQTLRTKLRALGLTVNLALEIDDENT